MVQVYWEVLRSWGERRVKGEQSSYLDRRGRRIQIGLKKCFNLHLLPPLDKNDHHQSFFKHTHTKSLLYASSSYRTTVSSSVVPTMLCAV